MGEMPEAFETLNIRRPTLVLDRARAVSNIERMAALGPSLPLCRSLRSTVSWRRTRGGQPA